MGVKKKTTAGFDVQGFEVVVAHIYSSCYMDIARLVCVCDTYTKTWRKCERSEISNRACPSPVSVALRGALRKQEYFCV